MAVCQPQLHGAGFPRRGKVGMERTESHGKARRQRKRNPSGAHPVCGKGTAGAVRRPGAYHRGGWQRAGGKSAVCRHRVHAGIGDSKASRRLRRSAEEGGQVRRPQRNFLRQALQGHACSHEGAESGHGNRHRGGQSLRRGPQGAEKAQRLCCEIRHDGQHQLRPRQPLYGGRRGQTHSGKRSGRLRPAGAGQAG